MKRVKKDSPNVCNLRGVPERCVVYRVTNEAQREPLTPNKNARGAIVLPLASCSVLSAIALQVRVQIDSLCGRVFALLTVYIKSLPFRVEFKDLDQSKENIYQWLITINSILTNKSIRRSRTVLRTFFRLRTKAVWSPFLRLAHLPTNSKAVNSVLYKSEEHQIHPRISDLIDWGRLSFFWKYGPQVFILSRG